MKKILRESKKLTTKNMVDRMIYNDKEVKHKTTLDILSAIDKNMDRQMELEKENKLVNDMTIVENSNTTKRKTSRSVTEIIYDAIEDKNKIFKVRRHRVNIDKNNKFKLVLSKEEEKILSLAISCAMIYERNLFLSKNVETYRTNLYCYHLINEYNNGYFYEIIGLLHINPNHELLLYPELKEQYVHSLLLLCDLIGNGIYDLCLAKPKENRLLLSKHNRNIASEILGMGTLEFRYEVSRLISKILVSFK